MLISTLRTAIGCVTIFAAAEALAADRDTPAGRAERLFQEAQQRHREQPTNVHAAIDAAQAAFNWAEFAGKDSLRAGIAQFGIAAARDALAASPTNAAAHYWLGMNLGQFARTKSLGALRLVREMEAALLRATRECAMSPMMATFKPPNVPNL